MIVLRKRGGKEPEEMNEGEEKHCGGRYLCNVEELDGLFRRNHFLL